MPEQGLDLKKQTRPPTLISRRRLLRGLSTAGILLSARGVGIAAPKRPMRYVYAPWTDGLAITYVGAALLEEKYRYNVELIEVDVAIAYTSLETGKADVYSIAYMEGLGALKGVFKGGQSAYVKKIADKIEVLGVAEGPMDQGLAVPEYVEVKSIQDLNKYRDRFDGKIIGIDPGSGLMQTADRAVKAYGLNLTLVPGSEAAMVAAFKRAYDRKEWIVVTTWRAHPMWVKFKMRYLDDPKKVMMEEPFYNFHIVRKDFTENFPEAYNFFKKYHLSNDHLAQVMGWIDEGTKPKDAAAKWIAENRGKGIFEKWFE